jgi:hypothetical protein
VAANVNMPSDFPRHHHQRHDAMRFPVFLVVRCVKGGAADSARGR